MVKVQRLFAKTNLKIQVCMVKAPPAHFSAAGAFFVGIFRFLAVLYCTWGISCGTIGKPINIM